MNVQKINILSYFPLVIEIDNFGFLKGRMKSAKWDVNVSKAYIHTTLKKLKSNNIDKIELKNIVSTLIETNPKLDKLKNRTSKNKVSNDDQDKKDQNFVVNAISVEGSQFNYIKKDPESKDRDGFLKFENVSLNVNDIIIKNSNLEKPIAVQAEGYLAKNLIKMQMSLDSFAKDFNLQLKTSVQNADIGSMNTYLIPVENIKIYGKVISSSTYSEMQNRKLTTNTKVEYSDLKIDVLSEEDERSVAMSVIGDIFANLQICNSKSKDHSSSNQEVSVLSQKQESVVQFLLRGLLDNYMKISCVK